MIYDPAVSICMHINCDANPPPNRIALFYFLQVIDVITTITRIEIDVTDLNVLALAIGEEYVWTAACNACFVNALSTLSRFTGNKSMTRILPH